MNKINKKLLLGILLSVWMAVGCSHKMYQSKSSEPIVSVIPEPAQLQTAKGQFVINENTHIWIDENNAELRDMGQQFAETLNKTTGYSISVNEKSGSDESSGILISLDNSSNDLGEEGYMLDVNKNHIVIRADKPAGVFYGIQTVKQLLPREMVESKSDHEPVTWAVPAVHIKDQPRFSWRGMHIDVSRHFFSVATVKQFIDYLAMYKFNHLHMHLTDDQGWRLQIKKYPKLTDEGAWRTLNGQDSLVLERGKTNPDFYLPEEHFKMVDGKRKYGGYYTQDQMRDLIQYAKKRFITIVPEIDMPGHMMSAIESYPELSCPDSAGWGSTFSVPVCPGKEYTYTFLQNVIDEVADLFPSQYIHIGADEVEKTTWEESEACQNLMKKEGMDNVEQLQSYFVQRMEKYIASKGKKMIGWDEITEGGLADNATMMYWRSWMPAAPKIAADNGNDIIMSPTSHCYFDYGQNAQSLKHVYTFQPVPDTLTKSESKYVIGTQANLWSERIPSPERLEYMAMPRMLALSEVAWSPKNRRDWNSFSHRILAHYNRLDLMGVNYRQPDLIGFQPEHVFVDQATVEFKKPRKEITLRYTLDGSDPDQNSALYTGPFKLNKTTTVKVKSFLPGGHEGDEYVAHYEQQDLQPAETVANLRTGLHVSYFEGRFSTVDSLSRSKVIMQDVVQGIKVPYFARQSAFGLRFAGLIQIPKDGVYTFFTSTDDGSRLYVGDQLVVDNDGPHSEQVRAGQIALKAGLHPFALLYFNSGGGGALHVSYKGPGMQRKPVSPNMLFVGSEAAK